MTKETNVYYEVLNWGHQRINEGVSFADLKGFLATKTTLQLEDKRAKALFLELFRPLEYGNLTVSAEIAALNDGTKFHLKLEAAFKYIELQELEEARQSSRSAMRIAVISIVIGIAVGVTQIWIALAN